MTGFVAVFFGSSRCPLPPLPPLSPPPLFCLDDDEEGPEEPPRLPLPLDPW